MTGTKMLNEKGGVGYASTGNVTLDFFARIGSARYELDDATYESAVKFIDDIKVPLYIKAVLLAYMRDRANGCGHRKNFYKLVALFLVNTFALTNVYIRYSYLEELVKNYGRYDDLFEIAEVLREMDTTERANRPPRSIMEPPEPTKAEEVMDHCYDIILKTIWHDLLLIRGDADILNNPTADKNVTLIGKWLPSINTSSKRTRLMARHFLEYINRNAPGSVCLADHYSDALNITGRTTGRLFKLKDSEYRKICSLLRKKIDIVEHHITAKEYYAIDYTKVPSLALAKYKGAWVRNDGQRFAQYLADVSSGKKKINTSTVTGADLVRALQQQRDVATDALLNTMWDNLAKHPTKYLVCRDGSGSMYISDNGICPIQVANALTLYCAENNTNYKDTFITFGDEVKFVTLTSKTFTERIEELRQYNDCGSTKLDNVFKTILTNAKMYKLTQEQLPEGIIIVSDMQFDEAFDDPEDSVFQAIQKNFEESGYKMPSIIFWNVSTAEALPICIDDKNTTILSGWNQNTLQYLLECKKISPESILDSVLNSERYKSIARLFY